MGLALPLDGGALLAEKAGGGGEEEGDRRQADGVAALSEPRMGAFMDTKKRVARRARRGVSGGRGACVVTAAAVGSS
jgi:hypothetical protein